MTSTIALIVLGASVLLFAYTYFGYPLLLWMVGRVRPEPARFDGTEQEWPLVSVSVPAYNEEDQIEDLVKSLLAIDYPRDRLQILVISDASDDRTDEIVQRYESQGIGLLRLEGRGGKTKAENAAAKFLKGDIVINTDASIRIAPDAVKPLVAAFGDPTVGCASGRDVSVGFGEESGNVGESGYVGYEMAVRDLETRVGGIVGASGCFYAIRRHLHMLPLPEALSRDFAAALHTREHGFRPVSVSQAVCYVPRSASLKKEYRRKVRTIARGMKTLWHKRVLLNPMKFGAFSWMLVSHKIFRWALPWGAVAAAVSLAVLSPASTLALAGVLLIALVLVLAAAGWLLSDRPSVPKVFSIPAYVVAGNIAAAHAFLRFLSGRSDALWEPTRRRVVRA